jgi:hypothetical protein
MFFGFFLNKNLDDKSKAIRYLEMAKEMKIKKTDKKFFLIRNELSFLYKKMYSQTKDKYYRDEFSKVYNEIVNSDVNNKIFSITEYKNKMKKLV